jgi:UDP-N-acetylglucosamine 2-epimerase (non-hydrolysing)
MSHLFFEELGIPRPDVNLEVGSASHCLQTARIMERFEPVILKEQPDVLIVVGDVNSTVACCLVASKISYNHSDTNSRPVIVHVEAGLRSFDRSMPEEINRVVTDALSDLLFITEEDALVNLQKEGREQENIHFVGNVMIDTLITHREKALKLNTGQELLKTKFKEDNDQDLPSYGIVTLHRPGNVDSPQTLEPLIRGIEKISQQIILIFPVHPRTKANLERFGLYQALIQNERIACTDSLGYLDFLNLLIHAKLVLTDSGGIQEETTYLEVPCVTLRNNTERPVTVTKGTNYLVGTNPDKMIQTALDILNGKGKESVIPPLWDGKAGERIINILAEYHY